MFLRKIVGVLSRYGIQGTLLRVVSPWLVLVCAWLTLPGSESDMFLMHVTPAGSPSITTSVHFFNEYKLTEFLGPIKKIKS